MDTLPFLGVVERPVRWEVAVTVQRGALDHAGGDRPASGERGRIVQVGLLVEQVGGGGVGGLALGGVQVVAVDQRDPGAVLAGVATFGFVEDLADDLGGVGVTLATSHLPRARGPLWPGGLGWSGAGRMSPGVLGTGAQS